MQRRKRSECEAWAAGLLVIISWQIVTWRAGSLPSWLDAQHCTAMMYVRQRMQHAAYLGKGGAPAPSPQLSLLSTSNWP
jgi:hypothetical protein